MVKTDEKRFLLDILTGIIVGINIIVSSLAYSGLILPGRLKSHWAQGFIVFIMSGLVASTIYLVFSKINFNISMPANQVVAIHRVRTAAAVAKWITIYINFLLHR